MADLKYKQYVVKIMTTDNAKNNRREKFTKIHPVFIRSVLSPYLFIFLSIIYLYFKISQKKTDRMVGHKLVF